ncbi:MAG: hypothetical protein WCF63_10380 [Acidimicrobiales bacterium]
MGKVRSDVQGRVNAREGKRERKVGRGVARLILASPLMLAATAVTITQGAAPAGSSTPSDETVSFAQQGCTTWDVPAGVTSAEIDAIGAAGATGTVSYTGVTAGALGGDGDGQTALLAGLPAQSTFFVCVDEGGGPSVGSGGAGGGASGVSLGTTFSAPLVVAGGGGGGGGGDLCAGLCESSTGVGGNAGASGTSVTDYFVAGNGIGGGGATISDVGAAGAGGGNGGNSGDPGESFTAAGPGVGGSGGGSSNGGAGGGGGGGFNGGGGGGATGNGFAGAGGGGGADYCGDTYASTVTVSACEATAGAGTGTAAQGAPGDPEVTITYTLPTPSLTLSDPSGAPVAGINTYDVTLEVPSGGPAPTQSVAVSDGTQSCAVSLTNPSNDGVTWTGICVLASEGASATVTASYSGDANYSDTTANSLTVGQASPTLLTSVTGPVTPGQPISASAQLQGGDAPGGSVSFNAYTSSACTGTPAFSSEQSTTVSGDATYGALGLIAVSPGTYYVDAVYSGDANNATVTSACSSAVTVSPATKAPAFTSAPTAYFSWLGHGATFHVTAVGTPTPTISESGPLPQGLQFNASTDTISGTAGPLSLGSRTVTLTASNGVTPAAVQKLNIVVGFAPQILTPSTSTLTVGRNGTVAIVSLGSPTATLSEIGTLPPGVVFTAFANGTAVLSGTPGAQSGSSYAVSLSASNAFGSTSQSFVLRVSPAPSRK